MQRQPVPELAVGDLVELSQRLRIGPQTFEEPAWIFDLPESKVVDLDQDLARGVELSRLSVVAKLPSIVAVELMKKGNPHIGPRLVEHGLVDL
jgi:hypothetical protein